MDRKENEESENKIPIVQQASEYLEKHQIYELLSSLMSSLAIKRPSSPRQYIIQQLTSEDPCKVCVISNNPILSEKCCKILESKFKAKIYSFNDNEIDDQIQILQSETTFVLQNYPTNKKQALNLLDSRIIPDRIFLITNQTVDTLDQDIGDNDLISLSNVFKHNTRIICYDDKNDKHDLKLEQLLLSSYYEQRKSYNNHLSPKFAPRVLILGPPNIGKTKLALYLRDRMNMCYLNAKHIMNQHIQTHTKFGIESEKIILNEKDDNETHFFVKNDLIVQMIAHDIFNDKDIFKNGYVLDNFPRTVNQSKCLIKYNIKPNRIIILTAKDSSIIEKAEECKYLSDDIETPGISYDDKSDITVHGLLGGFKENIEDIKSILCDKKITSCGVRTFDTESIDWGRILELSYDFIIQPLPKQ